MKYNIKKNLLLGVSMNESTSIEIVRTNVAFTSEALDEILKLIDFF